jgi:hypothetical protein
MAWSASERWSGAAAVATAWVITACAGGPPPEAQPTPESAVHAPLPGANYVMAYESDGAVYGEDTRSGARRRLTAPAGDLVLSVPSPDGARVAVALERADSSGVRVIDAESGTVIPVYDGPSGVMFTLTWSADGTRLGAGFAVGGRGGILVLGRDGAARNMGCQASSWFVAWRSASEAVVADGANFYVVRAADCETLATVSKAGMTDPEYSGNGTRLAYYQERWVRLVNGAQPDSIPELWIAGYDGSGARVIADYQSRPRHSVWAPNGSKIVYEVVSRRWANTTHLVTYEPSTDKYEYIAKEMELGVPNDFSACWSPDGRRFAHERTYARRSAAQRYTTRQVVVREGTTEKVVFDEVIDLPQAQVVADPPARCRWMGPGTLLVASHQGQRVIGVDDREMYTVPPDRRLLAVEVIQPER